MQHHYSPASWLMKVSPVLRRTDRDDVVQSHTSHGRCPAHFSTPARIIYDHELILYRNCTCSVEFDDCEVTCPPDSFIIIPPGKWHSEFCHKSRGGQRYWCHFDWVFHSSRTDSPVMSFAVNRARYELCHAAPGFIPPKLLYGKIPDPPNVYALGERLKSLTCAGSAHEMLIAGTVLHELLIHLLDTGQTTHARAHANERSLSLASRMRQILDVTALKSNKSLKLSAAFSDLNSSYEHLCRVFKEAYGVSPLRYVHTHQMTRARTLLKNSDLTVSEICFSVGMNSPAHFTKIFRSLVGKTPSEYRKGL
jgi:AraC-like DNA-binding protein